MADVQPFRALHYDPTPSAACRPWPRRPTTSSTTSSAPSWSRARRYNVVEIDLPRADGDPYAHAAEVLAAWQRDGILVRDEQPAIWALAQDYTGPDGRPPHAPRPVRARGDRGLRPGQGPPARAHAPRPEGGPAAAHARHAREPVADLLALRRPCRRRLGRGRARTSTARRGARSPTRTARSTSSGGSPTRTPARAVTEALAGTELLIADGHHRYETARVVPAGGRAPTTC